MAEGERVFVSSTCYDLIDIRAEVEAQLRELGLQPILSDRPSSEFALSGYRDSIEACFANVRASDSVVVILSQRYGPRLGRTGYPDISATHLEYREAKKANKPIFLYVRDRLEADYSLWKQNEKSSDLRFSWVREKRDHGLFELMEEHRKLLRARKHSNWVWTFRDSVELKDRISRDLASQSGRATLKKLLASGKLPLMGIETSELDFTDENVKASLIITNVGSSPAIDPILTFYSDDCVESLPLLRPSEKTTIQVGVKLDQEDAMKQWLTAYLEVMYGTLEGHLVADEFEFGCQRGDKTATIIYTTKRYFHSSAFSIQGREE